MLIKVRLCGLAWHGSQQCVRTEVVFVVKLHFTRNFTPEKNNFGELICSLIHLFLSSTCELLAHCKYFLQIIWSSFMFYFTARNGKINKLMSVSHVFALLLNIINSGVDLQTTLTML